MTPAEAEFGFGTVENKLYSAFHRTKGLLETIFSLVIRFPRMGPLFAKIDQPLVKHRRFYPEDIFFLIS